MVAAAWRSVLDEAPGIFEVVADHPATIRALASAHRELRDLSDTALDAVRDTSPLHAGLIELHRAATARIADTFYDETDLLTAATELVLGRPDTLRRWGRIVLYLPQRLSRAETRLARTFTALTDVTVLAGLTGDTKADAAVVEVLGDLGGDLDVTVTHSADRTPRSSTPPTRTTRFAGSCGRSSTPSARVPAHRIAILHSGDVPYARLLHEQLAAAGITFNGRGTRAIAERSLSRGLLGILALTEDLPRSTLFRALAEAPVKRSDGSQGAAVQLGAGVPAGRRRPWHRLGRPARALHPRRTGHGR